jgi:FixJ family two-component response regulator
MTTSDTKPTVFIVDDEENSRKALYRLFLSAGFAAHTFESAAAFLEADLPWEGACLILDLRMPEMSGLELQNRLRAKGITMPIIFYTGYADVPVAVRAMQAGAFEVIEKPFSGDLLIERVKQATEHGKLVGKQREQWESAKTLLARLSQRETEVAKLLADGMTAPQIGTRLGISPRTVEAHRGKILEKLNAKSTAEVIKLLVVASLHLH